MFKKTTVLLAIFLIGVMPTLAQEVVKQKAPIVIELNNGVQGTNIPISFDKPVTAANYVAVDTMANSFGPGSNTLNPVAYDPYSKVAAVVHRGFSSYAVGSGELWWNYSTDYGTTWNRSNTSVQNGVTATNLGRYPSMCIANFTNSPNMTDVLGVFTWPELNPSTFGFLGYGVSEGLMQSSFAAINQGPPAYGSNVPSWSDDQYAFWYTDNSVDNALRLFRTTDFLTIDIIDPPTWATTRWTNGNIVLGGVYYNGVNYAGAIGSYTEVIGAGGWEIGYSRSTDHGTTWSDWSVPNWLNIPATANYDQLWDWKLGDEFVSYSGDIQVDANGFVHLITALTDTNTTPATNAIVEFYETAIGVWDAKIIASGAQVHDKSAWYTNDPGIGQTGPSFMLSTNKDRNFFVAQYNIGSPATADTLCDIYIHTRALSEANWSGSTNLTQTNSMNEDGSHVAPLMATTVSGTTTTDWIFSMFWYERGVTGPTVNTSNPSVVYLATVPVRVTTGINDYNLNLSYTLEQNYPNPFNPTTSITYSIPERSNVSLKIYNVLGVEVASLVNEFKDAGTHSLSFDASKLASGVYMYTLAAGKFTETKKMMLMK